MAVLISNLKTNRSDRIIWYTLLLFVFLLPISQTLSARVLVVLFITSLLFVKYKPFINGWVKASWDILLYLIFICIGVLYSSNHSLGFRTLETSFALFAVPLICYRLIGFEREKLNTVFISLTSGVLTASLICTAFAIIQYFTNSQNTQVFFFYEFTRVINSHPTYLAYYLIFAITIGLYYLNFEQFIFSRWLYISAIIFCFIILLLTGGQTAFVGLLFVFSFFLLKFFLGQNRTPNQRLTFGLVVSMFIVLIVVNSGKSTHREQELNDSWDRFELWRSAILANTNPIIGVGTGDYKQVLNQYYMEHNQPEFANEELNAHNQFIQIFFSNGILGLLAVLIILLRPLYMAFKHNDQLGILIIFPFLIYGMTEVFLGRYQGVAFFAILHAVLTAYYSRENILLKDRPMTLA